MKRVALLLAGLLQAGEAGRPIALGQAQGSRPLESPQLAALERAVKAGNPAAVQQFWNTSAGNAPLIEAIPGDDRMRLITFLWRGEEGARDLDLKLVGYLPPNIDQQPLRRLGQTNVWFLSVRLPAAARFTYGFTDPLGRKRAIRDPLNPLSAGNASLAELPAAPPQTWIRVQPSVLKGAIKQDTLASDFLKERRVVSVYTPASYGAGSQRYGVLVLLDGEAYRTEIPTPIILDNLAASRRISPLVALLVHSGQTRDRDLQCSPAFADFLAKELLPWARRRYRLSADPTRTTVGGSSFGGLAAACSAFRHPETFGNVLAQSGSFGFFPGWNDEGAQTDDAQYGWLTRRFAASRRLPTRFYLEAGLFETGRGGSILTESRRLRDVLEAKGYFVVYSEFAGGHEYLNWRGSLADGLIALAGRRQKP